MCSLQLVGFSWVSCVLVVVAAVVLAGGGPYVVEDVEEDEEHLDFETLGSPQVLELLSWYQFGPVPNVLQLGRPCEGSTWPCTR